MTAPVSPIATQETLAEALKYRLAGVGWGDFTPIIAEAFRAALSSAERRIEELVRERDAAWRASDRLRAERNVDPLWKTRATDAEALVTTLKAEVEELKRERDDLSNFVIPDHANQSDGIVTSHAAYLEWLAMRERAEAAEAIASTMRERLEHVKDTLFNTYGADLAIAKAIDEINDAIRSLPVLPTTGDGGGAPGHTDLMIAPEDVDAAVGALFAPTGRETSGEET